VLYIESRGHAVGIFINDVFLENENGNSKRVMFKLRQYIYLHSGKNEIAILSTTMGLSNFGSAYMLPEKIAVGSEAIGNSVKRLRPESTSEVINPDVNMAGDGQLKNIEGQREHMAAMVASKVALFALLMLAFTAARITAQLLIPPRYDGFVYKDRVTVNSVLVEAFFDPLCPYSRDSWWLLKETP
jgi:hypothetical protein